MSSENPYLAPQHTTAPPILAEMVEKRGLWRDANKLVMHRRAHVSDKCLKSNVPVKRTLKRTLSWHHPAIFVAVLVSPLIYIILALVLRKMATIHIGLSDEWFAKRRTIMLIGWTLSLAGIGMCVGGIASMANEGSLGVLLLVGVFVTFGGMMYGLIRARMVAATRMTDDYIWLKGVHPEFLADLPPWPQP
jgi:hypothetical protein